MGKAKAAPFEYCEVCRLSQNEGRRHRYLPRHVRALSSLLSRFFLKLQPLRSSVLHPSLSPSPSPSLWCPFCSSDVAPSSPSPSFQWEDAIYHLSGEEHLKNLKDFLWKHGGGIDNLDSFRVLQLDLVKWEKKCETMRAACLPLSNGTLQASKAKDIQNQFTSRNVDSLENEISACYDNKYNYGVMPLQNHTNERCRESFPEVGLLGISSGPTSVIANSSFQRNGGQLSLLGNGQKAGSFRGSKMDEATAGKKHSTGEQFSALPLQGMNGDCSIGCESKAGCSSDPSASCSDRDRIQKLNPNRVGAAWAERRRLELEMEKKGVVITQYDPNWLPDFGRVWQAGTRKDSMKEFLTETKKLKRDTSPEVSVAVQPYVSKRMRLASQGGDASKSK